MARGPGRGSPGERRSPGNTRGPGKRRDLHVIFIWSALTRHSRSVIYRCSDTDVGAIKGERDGTADQSGATISLSDHV
jgi:hypothetical protein